MNEIDWCTCTDGSDDCEFCLNSCAWSAEHCKDASCTEHPKAPAEAVTAVPGEHGHWTVFRHGGLVDSMTGYGKPWAIGLAEWYAAPSWVRPGNTTVKLNGKVVYTL